MRAALLQVTSIIRLQLFVPYPPVKLPCHCFIVNSPILKYEYAGEKLSEVLQIIVLLGNTKI